jgi:TonB-dependent SusC/RagA subfamily outer membrane receptor
MKLIGLVCAAGVLVSGGCAESLTAPPAASSRSAIAPNPRVVGQALFVLDGRILNDQAEVQNIDPARIDNIQVLKGAAAVERFGERGANGVVLITLKQAS